MELCFHREKIVTRLSMRKHCVVLLPIFERKGLKRFRWFNFPPNFDWQFYGVDLLETVLTSNPALHSSKMLVQKPWLGSTYCPQRGSVNLAVERRGLRRGGWESLAHVEGMNWSWDSVLSAAMVGVYPRRKSLVILRISKVSLHIRTHLQTTWLILVKNFHEEILIYA